MTTSEFSQRVEAVRRFNRFYTRQIGILGNAYLQSPFSLAEVRVLYEIAHHETTTASELSNELGLDAGYLSRILRHFSKQELIERRASATDGRQTILSLSEPGRQTFAGFNARSQHEVGQLLGNLAASEQTRLVNAMSTIEQLLGAPPEHKTPYLLRPHQPGDMGWVVHRHAVLYTQEYGWDEQFEVMVADVAAGFVRNFDSKYERCWIAEVDGEIVGSVFLVKKSDTVAKLRLLLIEPKARGLGIGRRLVDECGRFARQAGYRKITLWTNSILLAARHIYQRAGYQLVYEEPHHSFGKDLIGETWELTL
jgi:DNA-binding MarR family transcriptional regulator/GNAT superfamily N-acetyltransferase